MNNFEDDEYNLWKIKWQLSCQGNGSALQEIKNHISLQIDSEHPLLSCNFASLLQQSKIYHLQKDQTYGSYQLYSKVPIFILLQGQAFIQCINMEGDNQIVAKTEKSGLLEINEASLKGKYGQTNITLITQFQIVGLEKSVLIELNPKSVANALKADNKNKISLRQELIMRKYMLISLKHIAKMNYSKGTSLTQKFYLLEGRCCYYNTKTKNIISCYQEGFFNPLHLQNTDIKLYIFQGSFLMILQSEMLKDEVASGIQSKREQHFSNILKKYEKMTVQERNKIQQKLVQKYKLKRQEVQKQIWGIEKIVEKRSKTKNDLIQTSSSMKDSAKDKCGIRIRKTKKLI